MPEGGIPGNGCIVHLQLRRPSVSWTAHLSHRKLFSVVNGAGPPASLVLWLPLLFASFGRPTSPSSWASVYLFLLRSGLGFNPRSAKSWGRGGWFTGRLDLLFFLGRRRLVPSLHELPQTWASLGGHLFFLVIWRVTHVSYYRGRSLNARVLVHFFLDLWYNNGFLLKSELVNFFLKRRGKCSSFLDYSLCKGHLWKWLGGQRNTLRNGMINWWKIVWS